MIRLCDQENISIKTVVDKEWLKHFMKAYDLLFQLESASSSHSVAMKYTRKLQPLAEQLLQRFKKNKLSDLAAKQSREEPDLITSSASNQEFEKQRANKAAAESFKTTAQNESTAMNAMDEVIKSLDASSTLPRQKQVKSTTQSTPQGKTKKTSEPTNRSLLVKNLNRHSQSSLDIYLGRPAAPEKTLSQSNSFTKKNRARFP